MIKYTDEMIEQDTLLELEKEDFATMERLHKEIVQSAKEEGYTLYADVINYGDPHGVSTELFNSEEECREERNNGNGIQVGIHSSCYGLIRAFIMTKRESEIRSAIEDPWHTID